MITSAEQADHFTDIQTKSEFQQLDEIPPHEQYIIDVLLNCADGAAVPKDRNISTPTPGDIQPCPKDQRGAPLVVPILLSTIESISHIRIVLPKDLRQEQARDTIWKCVLEVQRRFPEGITLLDPVENMGIKDDKFLNLIKVSWIVFMVFRLTTSVSDGFCTLENRCGREEIISQPISQRPSITRIIFTLLPEGRMPSQDAITQETDICYARHSADGGAQVSKTCPPAARVHERIRHRRREGPRRMRDQHW